MSKPPRKPRPKPANYSFDFLGFRDDWYLLRADMSITLPDLESVAFQARITSWLISQRITPGKWSHFGSGNTGEYPLVPEVTGEGHFVHLLLKRPSDVLRLAANFPVTGINPETFMAAVLAEASVHRFVVEDIAKLAHESWRGLSATFGQSLPAWDSLGGETRVAMIQQITHRASHRDETAQQVHATFVAQRQKDGWTFGGEFSAERLTDPLIVPWTNLRPLAQTRYQLFFAVVDSLLPLLAE